MSEQSKTVTVAVNGHLRHQTMMGFGSTIFDWANPHDETPMMRGVPAEIQEEAMRLAYQEMGLNRARFFVFDWYHREDAVAEPFDPQTLRITSSWFDTLVDTMRRKQRYGLDTWFGCPRVEHMPPWCLRPDKRTLARPDAYAGYVTAFLLHWQNDLGFNVPYWDFCNEPSYPPHQPQTISLDEMCALTKHLGARFRAAGLDTQLVIADDWTPGIHAIAFARHILSDPEARQYVGALAYHSYDGYENPYNDWRRLEAQRREREELRAVCLPTGVPIWMTEICNTRHRTEDDWADAFFRANEIHDELAHADASAWDYMWSIWEANWRVKEGWGKAQAPVLIYFNEQGQAERVEMHEVGAVISQWSRFARPGSVRLEANSDDAEVRATVFERPREGEVVLVVLNNRAAEVPVRFTFRALPPLGEARVYRTSRHEKVTSLPSVQAQGDGLSVVLKGESVTTLVCRRA
ncbi:MAG: hypothetical protein IT330_10045 [Anaerolineae bacterium]|nr:hypothetical protein [Anaerolineae bacterium]